MASLRPAITQLRGRCQSSAPPWQQLRLQLQGLHITPKTRHTRPLSTTGSLRFDNLETNNDSAAAAAEVASREADSLARLAKMIANLDGAVDENEGQQERQERVRPRVPERQQRASSEPWSNDQQMGGWASSDRDRSSRGDEINPKLKEDEELEAEGRGMDGAENQAEREIFARPIPTSPSYFSRQPDFNDSYLRLQKLMRKFAHLPTAPSDQIKRVAFRSLKDYRLAVGEDIKAAPYARCMTLVKRLHRIHPDVKPKAIDEAIAPFVRDINPYNQQTKVIPIDKFGRTLGVGKRKTSTARAWVVEGVGEVLVNGKSLADAFGRVHDRESAVWALKATARADKYNVWALVEGGGTTGQAEALAMAVGKALMAHEPALKPALRRGECWTAQTIFSPLHANIDSSWCCDP